MKDLEGRVAVIEARNQRVELDKKWETSWTRRLCVTALTYMVAAEYLMVIHNGRPLLDALVPAGGFFLSTLLLKSIRDVWQDRDR